jgi:hypothetical protein
LSVRKRSLLRTFRISVADGRTFPKPIGLGGTNIQEIIVAYVWACDELRAHLDFGDFARGWIAMEELRNQSRTENDAPLTRAATDHAFGEKHFGLFNPLIFKKRAN